MWFLRETPLARKYSRLPPDKFPMPEDMLWMPRSIIEHTSKLNAANPDEHILTLPNWFVEKENL